MDPLAATAGPAAGGAERRGDPRIAWGAECARQPQTAFAHDAESDLEAIESRVREDHDIGRAGLADVGMSVPALPVGDVSKAPASSLAPAWWSGTRGA